MNLQFEWSIDPETDSSDHLYEGPVYPLWRCQAWDLDSDAEDDEGSLLLASVGACDFGPECDPGWLPADDPYRCEIEQSLADEITARC